MSPQEWSTSNFVLLNKYIVKRRGRENKVNYQLEDTVLTTASPKPTSRSKKPVAPVVQKMDSAIHWINHYLVDSTIHFINNRGLDNTARYFKNHGVFCVTHDQINFSEVISSDWHPCLFCFRNTF